MWTLDCYVPKFLERGADIFNLKQASKQAPIARVWDLEVSTLSTLIEFHFSIVGIYKQKRACSSRLAFNLGSAASRRSNSNYKMGRAPCCEKMGLKRGPWTPEEDRILIDHINTYGYANWRALPKQAGSYPFLILISNSITHHGIIIYHSSWIN